MNNPESVLSLAKRFVAAVKAKDAGTLRQIYSPDARIWHNFDGKYQTVDENIRGMYWIHKVLGNVERTAELVSAENQGNRHPPSLPPPCVTRAAFEVSYVEGGHQCHAVQRRLGVSFEAGSVRDH